VWWAGDRLQAYLGHGRVALVRAEEVVLDVGVQSVDEAVSSLVDAVAKSNTRPRLTVWLSGGLCRPFLLRSSRGLRGASEIDAAASALAAALMTPGSPPRIWLDAPRGPDKACLGAAAEESLVADLEDRLLPLVRGRMRVAPFWLDALRGAGSAAASVSVEDSDSLVALQEQSGAVSMVRSVAPIPQAMKASTLQRWRAAGDLPASGHVHVRLCETRTASAAKPMALGCLAELAR
jgi:hypothetical protein